MSNLCFILMPFGMKRDPSGGPDINFDRVYDTIAQGVADAGLEPVRADHEVTGGIIHKPMFERLLLCEFAVADLTTANPNVFYELGIRHAARPHTTLPIYAKQQPIPFDMQGVRAMAYVLGENNAFTNVEAAKLREDLGARLKELRHLAHNSGSVDSPILQLLQGYHPPDLAHLRTDQVEEHLVRSAATRRRIQEARAKKPEKDAEVALVELLDELGDLRDAEIGIVVDLYLSFRAVQGFDRMLALYDAMPKVLKSTVLIREQRAFALNRKAAKATPEDREHLRDQAEELLKDIIAESGANAETCGLLGRIYKDRWTELREHSPAEAAGWLEKAIEEYTRGFNADWRDAYPGVNAATLLELEGSEASLAQRDRIAPVVRFAVERKLEGRKGDYWDYVTLLELSVLANDWPATDKHLGRALAAVREAWMLDTTAANLKLIETGRAARGEDVARLEKLRAALAAKATQMRG
jgi:hypothetical protein